MGRSWIQIKAVTGDDCIPNIFKSHVSFNAEGTLEGPDGFRFNWPDIPLQMFSTWRSGGGYRTMLWVLYVREQLAG